MGVLGEMFPGRKVTDEKAEEGDAQPWRLGPIDLERGVVTVHRPPSPTGSPPADAPDPTAEFSGPADVAEH